MLRKYKEIWYGVATGASFWSLDAFMNARLQDQFGLSSFFREAISHSGGQFLFRLFFVIIATAFGYSFWRGNQRKQHAENLQLTIDELHRNIASPLMLITRYSQMLSLREGWPVTREAIEAVRAIQVNAQKVTGVLTQLPPPSALTEIYDMNNYDGEIKLMASHPRSVDLTRERLKKTRSVSLNS